MSDDEYDDELPPIDVNSSLSKKNQYVMPSADVIASQRAYEEECEQELRQMRSQYEREDVTPICHDSSGSEGEATLAAAIEAMKVQSNQTMSQLDAVQLLQKLIATVSDWELTFLQDYLDVLQNEDAATVRYVTDNIMSSIEDVVKQSVQSGNTLNNQELKVVGLWLCAANLWSSPRVPSARRCLHVILGYLSEQELESWCSVVGKSLDSAALVRASDIIAAGAASAALLRSALHSLAPQYNLDKTHTKLSVEEVCEALGGVWRTLSPAQQYTAAQVAGRALIDVVDMTETPVDVTLKSEVSVDVPVKIEASMDIAESSDMLSDVSVKSEASMDETVMNKLVMDVSAKSEAAIIPTKTEAASNSDAISRLLTLMATQLPQHRYRPDYLRVLMVVSKLQNLFKTIK